MKEKAHQQQRGSLLKYIDPGSNICKDDDTPSSPPQNQETETASTANVTRISTEETAGASSIPRADTNISLPSNLPSSPSSPGQEIAYSASDIAPQETANISSIIGPQTAEQISVHSEEDTFNDPSNWPTTVTQGFRDILIERGPYQEKGIDFPRDSAHRKFSVCHYRRTLTNGERLERPWLVYPVSKDVTFCFCCMLFCGSERKSALGRDGVKDWKNLSSILSNHEKSTEHIESFHKWKELDIRLVTPNTIDAQNQRKRAAETIHWQNVLQRLISLIRVMSMQNLPFRGSTDRLFEHNNGTFLKLVEMMGLFDSVMAEHIRRVTSEETHVHHLGKDIQNEIIAMLASQIQQEILTMLRSAKYFSIILDCTPDVSRREQMTVIVRFVTTQGYQRTFLGIHGDY